MAQLALAFNAEGRVGLGRGGGKAGPGRGEGAISAQLHLRRLWAARVGGEAWGPTTWLSARSLPLTERVLEQVSLTSLCLHFFVCKMKKTRQSTLEGKWEGKVRKLHKGQCLAYSAIIQ